MATLTSPDSDRYALITGATSGIGAEFTRQLASTGYNVVIVARDKSRLDSMADDLRAHTGVAVEILVADLTDAQQRESVENRLASLEKPISYLVNNAGYGLPQDFDRNSIADEHKMLDVLATVPMRLSHAALGGMLLRRSGTILTVASLAGEAPLGLYSAAKAWPMSFSRWANAHYKHRGVTFTALAPGFVKTEFHSRLGIERESMAPRWMWLEAPFLVRSALRTARRKRAVSIPSVRYKLVWLLMKIGQPVILLFVARASRRSNGL